MSSRHSRLPVSRSAKSKRRRIMMNRLAAIFTAVALLVLPSLVLASDWNIDPQHSNIGFKVRHMMVSNVKGVFAKVQGMVTVDDQDITKSSVRATIDTAS